MHVYVCAHAHDWAYDAHVTRRPYVYDAVCMRGLMCMQCMGWEEHLHIHGTYNIQTRRESLCTLHYPMYPDIVPSVQEGALISGYIYMHMRGSTPR